MLLNKKITFVHKIQPMEKTCLGHFYLQNGEIITANKFDKQLIINELSLYEVVRIIDGQLLFWQAHYRRLLHSARLRGLEIQLSEQELFSSVSLLQKANAQTAGNVKIILNFKATVFQNYVLFFIPHYYPSQKEFEQGVPCISQHIERSNPQVKQINSAFKQLISSKLYTFNAFEALLINRHGFFTEGSRSNLFFVNGNQVFTPTVQSVLPGITRQVVIETCKDLNVPILETEIHHSRLADFDAIFITGTSINLLPVYSVDNQPFNTKNKLLKRLQTAYMQRVAHDLRKTVKY